MRLLAIIASSALVLTAVIAEGTSRPTTTSSTTIAPPAGRALLSRSANLEPYDYPPSIRTGFDPHLHVHPLYPVLGPPSFWTLPSLQSHYLSTLHLRYHPQLYQFPPPFEVWLKEQQLIRAINLLHQTIELELTRKNVDFATLLQHEMQLGELSVLLRYTQIATALRYAQLAPEWRRFEESMYRHWGAFLEVGQREMGTAEGRGEEAKWRDHLAFLEQAARQRVEDERRSRSGRGSGEWREVPIQSAKDRWKEVPIQSGEDRRREVPVQSGKDRWREVPVERGDLESTTPRRWARTPDVGSSSGGGTDGLRGRMQSSTPKRWGHGPVEGTSAGEDVAKGVREAFERGPRGA